MGETTGIAWTDSSWNPLRGCSKVSAGCANCYAEREANRSSGPGRAYEGLVEDGRWTGDVRVVLEHLDDPLRWQKPRRIFVNSMSDLFHENVSDETIAAVFGVMAAAPRHRFQVLTKRPERMQAWFQWVAGSAPSLDHPEVRTCTLAAAKLIREPFGKHAGAGARGELAWPLPNVWLGVSVEDQETADERILFLLRTPAAVRFVSAEPLLGPVNLRQIAPFDDFWTDALDTPDPSFKLNWVIVGGESGPGARPCEPTWIGDLVEQCSETGCACFVKQMGTWHAARSRDIGYKHPKGGDPSEWAEHLRVQEYPA